VVRARLPAFPSLAFEVHRVSSRGFPWNTWVAVEWTDRATAADGEPYENHGAHWIRLRWFKATHVHAYLDTQVVEHACRRMAANGIEEAAASPITD
jgi:ketosteroid isomerase-like protein